MSKKMGLALAMVCGLLAVGFASVALAGGTKVQGALKDSGGQGKIAMVVQSKDKIPTKLKKIEVTDVPYACDDGSAGSISSNPGSARVSYDVDTKHYEFFISYQVDPETAMFGFGTVSKDGRKVSGFVEVNFAVTTDGVTSDCGTDQVSDKAGDFKAKSKKN